MPEGQVASMLPVTLQFSSHDRVFDQRPGEAEAGLCAGGGEGSQDTLQAATGSMRIPFSQISVVGWRWQARS